jgi:hypothetical protein
MIHFVPKVLAIYKVTRCLQAGCIVLSWAALTVHRSRVVVLNRLHCWLVLLNTAFLGSLYSQTATGLIPDVLTNSRMGGSNNSGQSGPSPCCRFACCQPRQLLSLLDERSTLTSRVYVVWLLCWHAFSGQQGGGSGGGALRSLKDFVNTSIRMLDRAALRTCMCCC